MKSSRFAKKIKRFVDDEIAQGEACLKTNDLTAAFHHLERAHVLGQSVTSEHARVHWLMLKIGWKKRDWCEVFGQLFRIVGASTKTPFGIYPRGNTGGANVSPFKSMSIPPDLSRIIKNAEVE